MPAHHAALVVTAFLLVGLLLLGLSLQLGWRLWWRHSGVRWPHHALFFLVCAGTLLGTFLSWRAGERWWALLPALLLLLSMPRTQPGRANHWQRALLVALAFALGLALSW